MVSRPRERSETLFFGILLVHIRFRVSTWNTWPEDRQRYAKRTTRAYQVLRNLRKRSIKAAAGRGACEISRGCEMQEVQQKWHTQKQYSTHKRRILSVSSKEKILYTRYSSHWRAFIYKKRERKKLWSSVSSSGGNFTVIILTETRGYARYYASLSKERIRFFVWRCASVRWKVPSQIRIRILLDLQKVRIRLGLGRL